MLFISSPPPGAAGSFPPHCQAPHAHRLHWMHQVCLGFMEPTPSLNKNNLSIVSWLKCNGTRQPQLRSGTLWRHRSKQINMADPPPEVQPYLSSSRYVRDQQRLSDTFKPPKNYNSMSSERRLTTWLQLLPNMLASANKLMRRPETIMLTLLHQTTTTTKKLHVNKPTTWFSERRRRIFTAGNYLYYILRPIYSSFRVLSERKSLEPELCLDISLEVIQMYSELRLSQTAGRKYLSL